MRGRGDLGIRSAEINVSSKRVCVARAEGLSRNGFETDVKMEVCNYRAGEVEVMFRSEELTYDTSFFCLSG